MQKLIFLNDWFFNEKLLYDSFEPLTNRFDVEISKSSDLLNIGENDIIAGWGSGCLDILEAMNKSDLNNIKILISPYLDYDYFVYNRSDKSGEFEATYRKKTGILEDEYIDPERDVNKNRGRVVYPDKNRWFTNTYVFIGDSDRLVPFKYHLYFAEMYNGCSFHLIENAGFSPFYKSGDFLDILEANTPL